MISEEELSEIQQSHERFLHSPKDWFDHLGTPLRSDYSRSHYRDEEGIVVVSSQKNLHNQLMNEHFATSPDRKDISDLSGQKFPGKLTQTHN